jgi:calreticulin
MDDAAWYQITSRFKQTFNTSGKDFILQYTVRFENGYECSGGYIKLLNSSIAPLKFSSATPYNVMFGPEVCKPNRHKVQFMIVRNETDHDNRHYVDCFHDELTHAYTLIIFANRTYEVRLDGKKTVGGDLNTDFELGGTDLIPDPDDLIPDDWDNRKEIPDPDDHNPDDWDDRAAIPDPDAREPPEWREHVHGKWTPPLIQNPDYLGVWKPKMIKNPAYKGEWAPRLIPNPSFVIDKEFGVFEDLSYVGIEVFQAKPGSIYDNILVTDDLEYAEKQLRDNFLQWRDEEFAMYKRVQQDKQAEEELKKLREKENQQLTEEDFYTSHEGNEEEDSSSTTVEEQDDNFAFPSDDVSDAPTAADFEFPYDVGRNKYFLEKEKFDVRRSSAQGRAKWRQHRESKRQARELREDEDAPPHDRDL